MDPLDPTSFNHQTALLATGRTYHYVDQIPANYTHGETPVLLLLHGFPDLWYAWRNQIGPWCRHGWRVIAPDMIGYGGTDKPYDSEEYTFGKTAKDLAALLDSLSIDRVVVIGHDWGSFAAGKFCQWQTARVHAVVLLSSALTPRPPVYIPVDVLAEKLPDWAYMVFMITDRSPALFEKDVTNTFNIFFRTAKTWEKSVTRKDGIESLLKRGDCGRGDILSDKEFDYYVLTFSKGGFRGPTNWYRAMEPSWKEETAVNLKQEIPRTLPALFFHPGSDPTSPQAAVDAMKTIIPHLQVIEVEGSSHWILWERPEQITNTVIAWIDNVLQKKGRL